MTRRGIPIAAAALLATLAAAVLLVRGGGRPGVAVYTVRRGAFHSEVVAQGLMRAVHSTPISTPAEPQAPLRVTWLAPAGPVAKGAPIAVFDAAEFEKQQADGTSDRAMADQKIRRARVEGAQASRALDLDRALADDELRRAEDVAPTDATIFSRNEIVEGQLDRTLLRRRAEAARARQGPTRRLSATEAKLASIERDKALFRIERADRSLGALRVLAPHDGILVYMPLQGTSVSLGDTVWPGQPLAELPDLSQLEAHVFVLEGDAAGVAVGQTVRVEVEGQPGLVLGGALTRVDVLAKTRDQQSPVKYFEAVVGFDPATAPPSLKPGQRVKATVTVDHRPAVLVVPRGALMQREGRPVVYRWQGARFVPVEVVAGARSLGQVVIDQGLQEGDRIALQDPDPARSPGAAPEGAARVAPSAR